MIGQPPRPRNVGLELQKDPFPISTEPLSKTHLDELKVLVTETFLITGALSPIATVEMMLKYLLKLAETDRFYCLFTDKPEPTLQWDIHLFDETHGANDTKLDWLFRYSTRLFANWSGSDQYYPALVDRLAFALSSEVTEGNSSSFDKTMLTKAYLERVDAAPIVRSVLAQNRILVTVACLVLFADFAQLMTTFGPEGRHAK